MESATLSSKGQLVLPAKVRRQLRLGRGERLSIEVEGDRLILRPITEPKRYKTVRHPKTGLPVMVPVKRSSRKVTAEEIARLNDDLL